MISLEKWWILTKNVGYLGKLIVAKGFEKLPKVNKSTNLVTLHPTRHFYWRLRQPNRLDSFASQYKVLPYF